MRRLSSRLGSRSQHALPAIVLAFVCVLATACGRGGARVASITATTSTRVSASAGTPTASAPYANAVNYARCMRRHGEPGFPDPNNPGGFSTAALARLDTASRQFISADNTLNRARTDATASQPKWTPHTAASSPRRTSKVPDPTNGSARVSGSGSDTNARAERDRNRALDDQTRAQPGQLRREGGAIVQPTATSGRTVDLRSLHSASGAIGRASREPCAQSQWSSASRSY